MSMKIKLVHWTESTPRGKETKLSTVDLLESILKNIKPEQVPRGLDAFRQHGRLSKAFANAKKGEKFIELDDVDYAYIKQLIETSIVGPLASIPEVVEAVDEFLAAERNEEKKDKKDK